MSVSVLGWLRQGDACNSKASLNYTVPDHLRVMQEILSQTLGEEACSGNKMTQWLKTLVLVLQASQA